MIISIQRLTKKFSNVPGVGPFFALKNINLQVEKGKVCGIIGMSGAGKSTLMRCLTGLDRPSEGSVWIEEEEISALTGSALRQARRKIGMIFQHFNLFSAKTAWENVAYPLEIEKMPFAQRKQRAFELLDVVGLAHKAESYPAQLSGGEKQRVAIARALAPRPSVLLSDEATSALDPTTRLSILELLQQLNQTLGLTIVLITHEMEVVKQICTDVAVLEHGEIVEQGPVETLFSTPSHPTTRRFLQNLSHQIPSHFPIHKRGGELLRLFFKGEGAERPIISQMIKHHAIDVNILLGGIDVLRTTTVGILVVELSGSAEERSKARLFLEKEGVIWERILQSSDE